LLHDPESSENNFKKLQKLHVISTFKAFFGEMREVMANVNLLLATISAVLTVL
jgi:hypothetical protein